MASSTSILSPPALNLFETQLELFVTSPEYQSSMILSFGESHDYMALQPILAGGTSVLALIEIVPLAILKGAYGAFSRDTNKIYLASELLDSASPSVIADVLLEEYGHYIDAQLNAIETIGDEGEIFADLVQGKAINSQAFTEDGTSAIVLDGREIEIEQAASDLDTSFGGRRFAVSPVAGSPVRVIVQPDGKIIVGAKVNKNTDFGIVRFNSDGTMDTSFGNGGIVINNYDGDDRTYTIALQADGKILLGGHSYDSLFGVDGYVFRYNSDGTLDTSFDNNGVIRIYSYSSLYTTKNISKIEVQPDGKILVLYDQLSAIFGAGFISGTNLIRYNSDGSLDTSFGGDEGIKLSGENADGDLAILSNDTILVAVEGYYEPVSIKQFTADGKFIGSVTTPIPSVNNEDDDYRILAIQPDGKILIAGDSILVRYNHNGSLDKMLTTTDDILGLTVQDNGKILLLHKNGLSRFNSDFTPDISFGNGSVIPSTVGASKKHNLTLQGDGKILVAGAVNGFLSLVRYQGDVFDAAQYGASYTDLITGIGYNLDVLTQHYQNSGKSEGRQQDLFDELRYIASSYVTGGDLIGAFGLNGAAATQHYITNGFTEGRSLTAFIPSRYLLSQGDLLTLYGTNLQAASIHYISSGFGEGRNPNLFQSDRYIASHDDLIKAYRYNLEAGSNHYLFSGRGKGRQITFSPEAYLIKNPDVNTAYNGDLNAATQHYILKGFDEGRTWM